MSAGAYFAWVPVDLDNSYDNGTVEIPEAASQTFARGTPVVLDANGRIAAAGASPSTLFGVAQSAGQNGTAGQYSTTVLPLRVSQKWRIPIAEALAQNLMGQAGGDVGVVKDATTGFWYGSTGDGGAQARIVDYVKGPQPPGFNIGDTIWAGIVQFHYNKLQVV